MVRSARIHGLVRDAGTFGVRTGTVTLDWDAVIARQHGIVQEFQPAPDVFRELGAAVHLGTARFVDAHTVEVEGARLDGERIVIAAGSEPILLTIPGRELAITSDEILFLPEFPARLVLVGAGAIGLEMASAFADLGAEVTVIDAAEEILPAMVDTDVAAYLRAALAARGVTFHLGATIERLAGQPGAVSVHLMTRDGQPIAVDAAQVCMAIGRRFVPSRVGADGLGLESGPRGLTVSEFLRTSLPHVYAAGDAAGNHQLTPTAAYEGRVAAVNALRGDVEPVDYGAIPQTVFSTPEVARVGLTQREAGERGLACHVVAHDARGSANSRATGEVGGYLKLIFEGDREGEGERLLGAQIVSPAAAELIQLAAVIIRARLDARVLARQLSVHPSHGERLLKIFAHDYHEVCEPA